MISNLYTSQHRGVRLGLRRGVIVNKIKLITNDTINSTGLIVVVHNGSIS